MDQERESDGILAKREPGYYEPGTPVPAGYTLVKVAGNKGYELRSKFEFVDKDGQRFLVPKSGRLETDLASIPPFASWLVPKDGRHTQAALLHDAMIVRTDRGEIPDYEGPEGFVLDDEKADRIFLEGMRISGVPFIRRWMMWVAVSMRSVWIKRSWWYRLRMILSIAIVAIFGLFALPDLLDFPQYLPFKGVLWTIGIGFITAATILIMLNRGSGPRKLLAALTPVLLLVPLMVGAFGLLPDALPKRVPSLIPDIHDDRAGFNGRGSWLPKESCFGDPDELDTRNSTGPLTKPNSPRPGNWNWGRCTNDDPLWFQLFAFLGMLGIAAIVNGVLLVPRPRLGFFLSIFLGLLAFPLFFVLIVTGVYWLVEGSLWPAFTSRSRSRESESSGKVPTH